MKIKQQEVAAAAPPTPTTSKHVVIADVSHSPTQLGVNGLANGLINGSNSDNDDGVYASKRLGEVMHAIKCNAILVCIAMLYVCLLLSVPCISEIPMYLRGEEVTYYISRNRC